MECVFIKHGIAIKNEGILLPCCTFHSSNEYIQKYQVNNINNIDSWRNGKELSTIRNNFQNGQWSPECIRCQEIESKNRGDSVRLNGANSYSHYLDNDIVLEIRPGNTCNFACQTCWPQASSRVSKYYKDAEIEFNNIVDKNLNLDFLSDIKNQIKDIIILGGEPFYDKKCLSFLKFITDSNLDSNIIIFTNGSVLDKNFLENYPGKITLVFSIDAVGKPAEYIRFGTVWNDIIENYEYAKHLLNIEVRVNITTSPYNYFYLYELVAWLLNDWPSVVSFSEAYSSAGRVLDESIILPEHRSALISKLEVTVENLKLSTVELGQKTNAINAINSIILQLKKSNFNKSANLKFKQFVEKMDTVKGISINDYCPEVAETLSIK